MNTFVRTVPSVLLPALLVLLLVAPPAQASTLRAADVVRRVREANPAIQEARERALASGARARAQGRLPEPMAGVQIWNAPASNPLAAGDAEMVMYGVEQSVPLPPKLGLRRSVETSLASAADEDRRALENRLEQQALHAFHEYWRATEELAVHVDHVELSKQILATADSQYASGSGRQHDVLRANAGLARTHADVALLRQQVASAESVLRALMSLPRDAGIGAPVLDDPLPAIPSLPYLEERLVESRPEIRAASSFEASATAALRLARVETWMPDVMVGLTWMDSRMGDDGWMPMVRVSVPLVALSRWDARAAARHDATAARAARTAVTNSALAELRDAHVRVLATKDVLDRFTRDILPLEEAALESAQAAYAGGNGTFLDLLEASRALLDARLSRDRARARHVDAIADLELAIGQPLSAGEGR